jgi:hypothetical protein
MVGVADFDPRREVKMEAGPSENGDKIFDFNDGDLFESRD